MTNVMRLVSTLWTFPLCQAIFHQHQPTVSMHLSSFSMPVVIQIIVTFYHVTGPWWKDFCHRVTKLIICPTHLRILWQTHWSSWTIQENCLSNVCWLYQLKWSLFKICQSWIDKINWDGGCDAWGRSHFLHLEHLVITSISYRCTIHSLFY